MNRFDKISIIGNSGAGKSTLARKIGEKLNIEVFTIDKIYWLPGWKLLNRDIVEGCCYGRARDLQMKLIKKYEIELKPKILKLIKGLDSTAVQTISNEKELKLW